ncbi:MAG: hypothetical protein DMG92_16615 [Acidobacteria bacterium]|nr:MAG: hypothetical protein DMG92_16615 [Acidobacteriota bacterium]
MPKLLTAERAENFTELAKKNFCPPRSRRRLVDICAEKLLTAEHAEKIRRVRKEKTFCLLRCGRRVGDLCNQKLLTAERAEKFAEFIKKNIPRDST